jgi:hypothetical protein
VRVATRYSWIVLAGLLCAAPALGQTLEPPPRKGTGASGEDLLDGAYRNLFGAGSMLWIETTRRGREGVERSRFLVFQRLSDDARESLTVNLDAGGKKRGRILQIDRLGAQTKTYVFAESTERSDPAPTPFRLADPFLCNFYDPREGVAPGTPEPARSVEVLGKGDGTVDGEDVHVLTVRWLGSQGYDRVELAVSKQDSAILEYRHFLEAGDKNPSMIARASRSDMIDVGGRIVPKKLSYRDLEAREDITVVLQHRPLPQDLPATSFEPNAFHLVDLAPQLASAPW